MSSSVSGTGGRFHARAMVHRVFHRASLGFLDDWAYMSFSKSMMIWFHAASASSVHNRGVMSTGGMFLLMDH